MFDLLAMLAFATYVAFGATMRTMFRLIQGLEVTVSKEKQSGGNRGLFGLSKTHPRITHQKTPDRNQVIVQSILEAQRPNLQNSELRR